MTKHASKRKQHNSYPPEAEPESLPPRSGFLFQNKSAFCLSHHCRVGYEEKIPKIPPKHKEKHFKTVNGNFKVDVDNCHLCYSNVDTTEHLFCCL